ncbi:MAG: TetR/AcrR family transcriptional regulator [Anaerolineae bacterium]
MSMPREDRRVVRTKERLRNALVELLLEKPYKNISVQNILDTADVSRAAFYTHYQDKNELLLTGFPENILHYGTWDSTELLPPVTALFQHIKEGQAWLTAMQDTDIMHLINLKSRERMIENWIDHFAKLEKMGTHLAIDSMPVAFYLTGALMALLGWWNKMGMQTSPEELNDLFQTLARNGLSAISNDLR